MSDENCQEVVFHPGLSLEELNNSQSTEERSLMMKKMMEECKERELLSPVRVESGVVLSLSPDGSAGLQSATSGDTWTPDESGGRGQEKEWDVDVDQMFEVSKALMVAFLRGLDALSSMLKEQPHQAECRPAEQSVV